MSDALPPPPAPPRSFPWWLVLALVGLDYFSTLAYLPSIAVRATESVGWPRACAPLAALGIVLLTLGAALPVYSYVVGRSPHGEGATGLLDRTVRGWFGKGMVLVLLGFVATDLVVTRSLSVSDAATHIVHNPDWQRLVEWSGTNRDTVKSWFPHFLQGRFFDFWSEQLVLTVALTVAGFGFWWLLTGGLTRWLLALSAWVVVAYLGLTAVVIVGGLVHAHANPELWQTWVTTVRDTESDLGGLALSLLAVTLLTFPQMALGLSGFELSMASAPQVRGHATDTPDDPRGRVRNTRKLMAAAAVIMAVYLVGSVTVVTLLVPDGALTEGGAATHRALAYLAHGGAVNGGGAAGPLFGPAFGALYDASTVLILCLAGASVTVSLRDLVPNFLARFGMQFRWANRVGLTLHLFNVVILLVTVVFRASVTAQQWAYATSVLVLLTAGAVAALIDVRQRRQGERTQWLALAPSGVLAGFFLFMAALTAWQDLSGLAIAAFFIAAVFAVAFVSRWARSMELRFDGFTFRDEESRRRWEEVKALEFQVLVPHRPGAGETLAEKEAVVRKQHRLAADVPIVFLEVNLGDPSDFLHHPFLAADHDGTREVFRISRCASIAHVLAAVGLEMTHVGRPPELYFDWSEEPPLTANIGFLLLGRGNIPLMVHALVIRNQPDPQKRPRVVVG